MPFWSSHSLRSPFIKTMSRDNSAPSLDLKNSEVDPPFPTSRSNTAETMQAPPNDTPAPPPPPPSLNSASRRPPSFVPKTFPPPSLSGVPVEYIVDQLRSLASHYWNKTETADCTIIVPVPNARGCGMNGPWQALPNVTSNHDPVAVGRRFTDLTPRFTPRISLKLHSDYLSSQSTFLRGLFSGASPLDLINTSSNHPPNPKAPAGRFTIPTNRLPRLLPSTPNHSIVYLPVPDPASFHLLVHWMYFGNTSYIEDCLDQGVIQWEGIARNVEYLGLSAEIKIFLGRWYGNWLRAEGDADGYESSQSDDDHTTSDDEEIHSSTSSDNGEDGSMRDVERGRTRTSRHFTPPAPHIPSSS